MANWKITTEPTVEPISSAEAKEHLKVTGSGEDSLISDLIKAAREDVELTTGRKLIETTIEEYFDEWPTGDLMLRWGPVASVSAVQYLLDGTYTTVSTDTWTYVADVNQDRIYLKEYQEWPTGIDEQQNSIKVVYVAGISDAASGINEDYRNMVKMKLGFMYDSARDDMELSKSKELASDRLAMKRHRWRV